VAEKIEPGAQKHDLGEVETLLVPLLERREEILFAYVFGSLARGKAGRLSDVDSAVYVDEKGLREQGPFGYESELAAEIMCCLKRGDVDLVLLNRASTLLRFQVIYHGKLIFCRFHRERVQFHEKAFRDYQDIRPMLDTQCYYLKKDYWA